MYYIICYNTYDYDDINMIMLIIIIIVTIFITITLIINEDKNRIILIYMIIMVFKIDDVALPALLIRFLSGLEMSDWSEDRPLKREKNKDEE